MKSAAMSRKSRSKTTAAAESNLPSLINHEQRAEHIAVSAYYKAQARGFAPGGELDDWLQAEAELSASSSTI